MSLPFAQLLSTSGMSPAPPRDCAAPSQFILKDEAHDYSVGNLGEGLVVGTVQSSRRTRIWEFGTNLHCSIIGTCLSTAELRHLLVKLKVSEAAAASDHDLHCLGVMLASRREGGAKLLQKVLDRRHRVAVVRYGQVKETAGLLSLWEESLKQGDIPGAYWAALTHPVATEDVVKRAFSDVHMLSHLVGAANRADIRRLRQLEQEAAALAEKVQRQQRHLQDGFAERDLTIRRLREMLARHASEGSGPPDGFKHKGGAAELDSVVQELNHRLGRETARCERSKQREQQLSDMIMELRRALETSQRECRSLRLELDTIEQQVSVFAQSDQQASRDTLRLSGLTLLYAGGRAHQIPQFKNVVERAGACFLHHDGGIEHSSELLPGLVSSR